jgi:5-hydroxyisourate hydrolase-like protein (transthyretin family)
VIDSEKAREVIERMDTALRRANGEQDGRRRAKLIQRVIELRHELQIDFNTCDYWNQNIRKPDEAPINFDPDGLLKLLLEKLDAQIAAWVQ